MTGLSRTAFHAVPCIVTKPQQTMPHDIGTPCQLWKTFTMETSENCKCVDINQHLWNNALNDSTWKHFAEYISKTRININIRQVHKHKEISEQ